MVASRLRQRKVRRLADLEVPPDGLPGSLSLTHRRCGKLPCHCGDGEGHPVWSLTFMVQGKKRVERIPDAWVDDVRRQVDAERAFKEAVAEVFVVSAREPPCDHTHPPSGRARARQRLRGGWAPDRLCEFSDFVTGDRVPLLLSTNYGRETLY